MSKTIGERIKERRIQLGMSQTELGQKMGYKSKSSMSRIENEDVDLSRTLIMQFAEILKTTPQYLMGINTESTIPSTLSKRVGKQIEKRMEELHLSHKDLSNACGISVEELEGMINGDNRYFNRELMIRFCEALNVDYSYFMFNAQPVDNIGLNMKAIREISGETKENIAKHLGLEMFEYDSIENGDKVTYEQIEKFADYYYLPNGTVIGDNYDQLRDNEKTKIMLSILKICNRWNDVVGVFDLNDKELEQIFDYANFVVSKRK